jgi:hypothetical protein
MGNVPKNVKQPQDHLKPAAQREAEAAEVVEVRWREQRFVVPADADDWPVPTVLAFEEGKAAIGVRGVLGPDQWDAFLSTNPRARDMGDLFDHIARALGLDDAGE